MIVNFKWWWDPFYNFVTVSLIQVIKIDKTFNIFR